MKTIKLIATAPFIIVLLALYGIFSIGTLGAAMILAVTNEILKK